MRLRSGVSGRGGRQDGIGVVTEPHGSLIRQFRRGEVGVDGDVFHSCAIGAVAETVRKDARQPAAYCLL